MVELEQGLPTYLRDRARWTRVADDVPVLLAHPDPEWSAAVPVVLWMHGRTVQKEIDPGRYLRWLRAGIGVCAIDLPGHGERYESDLQAPERALDVVLGMTDEIDGIVDALTEFEGFDTQRIGIGGMSAGGMASIRRLTRPHEFRCLSLEATTGSWTHQRDRAMFRGLDDEAIAAIDPIRALDSWREIPVQAIHSKLDEWTAHEGQAHFIEALRAQYHDPEVIDFVVYASTGAPYEHAGFGRLSADAKERQCAFLARWLFD